MPKPHRPDSVSRPPLPMGRRRPGGAEDGVPPPRSCRPFRTTGGEPIGLGGFLRRSLPRVTALCAAEFAAQLVGAPALVYLSARHGQLVVPVRFERRTNPELAEHVSKAADRRRNDRGVV